MKPIKPLNLTYYPYIIKEKFIETFPITNQMQRQESDLEGLMEMLKEKADESGMSPEGECGYSGGSYEWMCSDTNPANHVCCTHITTCSQGTLDLRICTRKLHKDYRSQEPDNLVVDMSVDEW